MKRAQRPNRPRGDGAADAKPVDQARQVPRGVELYSRTEIINKQVILASFLSYACELGATQTARHANGLVSRQVLRRLNAQPHYGAQTRGRLARCDCGVRPV
jgi:hypothetical protein